MIGERTNVTGSPKFKKLVLNHDFENALTVARQQVEAGANLIDINFDEALLTGWNQCGIFSTWLPLNLTFPGFR